MKELKDANFDEIINSTTNPILIDFWAPWCGPCMASKPIIEGLEKEYEGKIDFYSINVDNDATIASKYKIMSIPSLLIFVNGNVVDQLNGYYFADKYREFLNKHIKKENIEDKEK